MDSHGFTSITSKLNFMKLISIGTFCTVPLPPDPDPAGDLLTEELPAYPLPTEDSWPKLHELARELKRRAALMTAGSNLHNIHAMLYLVSAWEHLSDAAHAYAAHRMSLLYIAVMKR